MSKIWNEFKKGLVSENPVLRLCLGTCPTLAISTAAMNGLGMGAAATLVLVCSNVAISLLRNIIPQKVRIPAFITIIAGFVTIVQLFVKAFLPAINEALGIYLPLIVVNCIILARAEAFASKNGVLISAIDGLGMGIGFTAALVLMGSIREVLGAGTFFGLPVTSGFMPPMLIFILPPGGFFVFGILVSLANRLAEKRGKAPATLGCASCPSANFCSKHMCELEEQEKIKGYHFNENDEASDNAKATSDEGVIEPINKDISTLIGVNEIDSIIMSVEENKPEEAQKDSNDNAKIDSDDTINENGVNEK